MSKTYKNSLIVLSIVMVGALCFSCATTDDYEGNANINSTNYENVALANGGNVQYDNGNYENGEELNNELYNEFADNESMEGNNYAMENEGEMFNNNSSMYNQSTANGMIDTGVENEMVEPVENTLMSNVTNSEIINSAPIDDSGVLAVADTIEPALDVPQNAAVMNAVPTTDYSSPLPTTGGIVKYVIENHVPIYDQPNGSASGSLEKGDHPLVWDEGAYSRTSQGKYIPADKLSTNGIGRARRTPEWR